MRFLHKDGPISGRGWIFDRVASGAYSRLCNFYLQIDGPITEGAYNQDFRVFNVFLLRNSPKGMVLNILAMRKTSGSSLFISNC